jgi:curli biogenesis system outer membrane secretion channel CsgG
MSLTKIAVATMMGLTASTALAEPKLARETSGQKLQQSTMNDVPHCARKLGTVSVADGDDPSGWTQFSLAPPSKLLKVMIQRSGCFNLVDRGTGLNAAERERAIGGNLGLQRGANVGQGQIKAADYVLVAEIQGANGNASGNAVGGAIGGLVGGRLGGVLGGIRTRKLEANTVLSLTNVRTTETIATEEGYAAKNDVSFGAGGGVGFLGGAVGAVGGGYENTDLGRIVTLSFIQAYSIKPSAPPAPPPAARSARGRARPRRNRGRWPRRSRSRPDRRHARRRCRA